MAVELCKSLRNIGQECLLHIVVEERAGTGRNANLMRSLGDVSSFGNFHKTRSRFSPRLLLELAGSFREQGVRILHCHCYKALFYALLMRTLGFFDGAVVYTLHGLILPKGIMSAIIRSVQRIGLRLADGVIGCSREILTSSLPDSGRVKTAAIINAITLPENDFDVLQHTKPQFRKIINERYGLDSEGFVVINVGRLCPQKNYPLYLELIRHELTVNPNSKARFFIVGSGELQIDLELMADQLGVRQRVIFTGFVSDMDTLYRGADLMVQTSIWEGTPMCLLEARSYGLPVVAPIVGGNADVIDDGRDGFLYPMSDLTVLIGRYNAYVASPELRQRHSKAAFERIGVEFGAHDWALKHRNFYKGLERREAVR